MAVSVMNYNSLSDGCDIIRESRSESGFANLKFDSLRNIENHKNKIIPSIFLSESNFKFAKRLSQSSNQENKHKTKENPF